jgi:predicted outer membrane protein
MDSGLTKTIGLAAVTALLAVFVARADGAPAREEAGSVAGDTSAHVDSSALPRWLTDANILALIGAMNARQIAAADAELQAWHSDTVRAFAASLAHDHAQLQQSTDSLAAAVHLAPVPAAINDSVNAALQAFVDSVTANRGPMMDRVYVRQQIASHQLMSRYLDALSTLAEEPELQALLGAAAERSDGEAAHAQTLQTSFVAADSIAADSLARRAAARRTRSGTNR